MAHTAPAAEKSRLIVRALWRDDFADARAAIAERRLVRTVAEWSAGAGVDVVVRSTSGGRVQVDIVPMGAVPREWKADVALALEGIATLASTATSRRPLAPTMLAELVRDSAHSGAEGSRGGWPRSERDASAPLLETVSAIRGGFVRVLLAATGTIERTMLDGDLRDSWNAAAHGDPDAYLGAPVLARTFVGVSASAGAGTSIAPLRAAVRAWGSALVLDDTDVDRARFDDPSVAGIRGAVRPEGWALAMLRLPACGRSPSRAMASRPRPVADRPIDTAALPPRATTAIELGTARVAGAGTTRVRLAVDDLLRHVFVEGRSGAGKTTLLATMAAELALQGVGFTLLEHHGSGVDGVLRALPDEHARRARVIRHGDAAAPASVNLLAERDPDAREQAVSEFVELVQSMFDPRGEGIVGPRWRRWFGLLADGVCAWFGPRATLVHVVAVAADIARVNALAARLAPRHPELAQRLRAEIGMLRGEEATNLTSWALSKFQPLVGQRAMREIVGRPDDSVDVARLMDSGGSLLVDLGGPTLGTASARMLGATWLLKHALAMGRRRDRRPHVLLVDEAHLYTFGALPSLLAESRKFGLGVVVATQSFEALAPAMQAAVEANVGSTFSFRLGLTTAPRASVRLGGWPVDELVRLPDRTAAASISRAGVQHDPFLLRVARRTSDAPDAYARALAADARNAAHLRAAATTSAPSDRDVVRALMPPSGEPRVADNHASTSPTDVVALLAKGTASSR